MSARNVDTLTRAAVESALIAAEAMARVEVLERQVAGLSDALQLAGRVAGRPDITAAAQAAMRPHLHLVEDGQ